MADGDVHHIGSTTFSPITCEIAYNGHIVHLQPQVRRVLLCLEEHSPYIVERQTFFDEAWNAKLVSDESLTRCISVLRKTFKKSNCPIIIETVPKVGYRLKITERELENFPGKKNESTRQAFTIVPDYSFLLIFFTYIIIFICISLVLLYL